MDKRIVVMDQYRQMVSANVSAPTWQAVSGCCARANLTATHEDGRPTDPN